MNDPQDKDYVPEGEKALAVDSGFGVGIVAGDLNVAVHALNQALDDICALTISDWPEDFHPERLFGATKSIALAAIEVATMVGVQAVAVTHPDKAREVRDQITSRKVTQ